MERYQDTVEKIMNAIYEETGIPLDKQLLTLEGKGELTDPTSTLQQAGFGTTNGVVCQDLSERRRLSDFNISSTHLESATASPVRTPLLPASRESTQLTHTVRAVRDPMSLISAVCSEDIPKPMSPTPLTEPANVKQFQTATQFQTDKSGTTPNKVGTKRLARNPGKGNRPRSGGCLCSVS